MHRFSLLDMLEKHIPIWPPIYEQKMMLDKMKVTRRLDTIAIESNVNEPDPRPRTYTIAEAERLPSETKENGLVLKRNSSSNHDHIQLPPLVIPLMDNVADRKDNDLGIYGTWYAQDYLDSLRTMGEMRVFLLDGKEIRSTIATRFTGGDSNMEMEDVIVENIPFLQEKPK